MFKRVFTISVIAGLLISIPYAQQVKKTGGLARLAGMGNNPYVIDPFFNTVNAAWNATYNNFVLGDLGFATGTPFSAGGGGQYLSTSFNLSRNWTLGGMLARNDFPGLGVALLDPGTNNVFGLPFPGVVATVNSLAGPGSVIPMDNNVVLMGTFSRGNSAFGLGIAYATTTNNVEPDTGSITEGSASQIGFNLGMVSNISRNFLLDVAVTLMFPSSSFKPSTGSETKASQTIISVNGRAFWKLKPDLQLVPILIFTTVSGTVDSGGTSSGSADMPSFTNFLAGLGLNYQIGDFLLAGGVSFATASTTADAISGVSPELTSSVTLFPLWNFGAEWNLLDWLVARLGYTAFTGSTSSESASSSTNKVDFISTFFTPTSRGATVGLGFRFGDFSLDATVNEDVLRQGFNIIGGGGASFAYMTASYAIP